MGERDHGDPEWDGHHNRRQPTLKDTVTLWGGLAGALLAIMTLISTGSGVLPDVLGLARAEEFDELQQEVSGLQSDISEIGLSQNEWIELQLMERIDDLEAKISNATDPETVRALRTTKVDLEQRLGKARGRIQKYNGMDEYP